MRIHVGCEIGFEFSQTTPMIVALNVHFSRVSDARRPTADLGTVDEFHIRGRAA